MSLEESPNHRTFFVPGVPVPQGSKTIAKHGDKVWLRDVNSAKLKAWRQSIADAVKPEPTDEPLTGPLLVELAFFLPRPKHPRFYSPAVKPDIDKLARAVFDALTQGGAIEDDARIVGVQMTKIYADEPHHVRCGVAIRITEN